MSRGTLDPALSVWTSLTGLSPSAAGLPSSILLSFPFRSAVRTPPCANTAVWASSVSLAATPEITFVFFSSGYLDVSVHRVPFHRLCIYLWIRKLSLRGFPHSDICGSQDICSSPQLFAACRVFRRLSVPGHPPCALFRLTFPSQPSVAAPVAGVSSYFFYFFLLLLFDVFYSIVSDFSVFGFQGTSAPLLLQSRLWRRRDSNS